jgi:hypothetical protein
MRKCEQSAPIPDESGFSSGAMRTCSEDAVGTCDHCDKPFCEEHGTPGGDRQVQDVGAVAYPSTCDECQTKCEKEFGR